MALISLFRSVKTNLKLKFYSQISSHLFFLSSFFFLHNKQKRRISSKMKTLTSNNFNLIGFRFFSSSFCRACCLLIRKPQKLFSHFKEKIRRILSFSHLNYVYFFRDFLTLLIDNLNFNFISFISHNVMRFILYVYKIWDFNDFQRF